MEEKSRIAVGPDQPIWAMGLMSGTSMDGVDGALLKTDGERIFEFGPAVELSPAYNDYQKGLIDDAGSDAARAATGTATADPALRHLAEAAIHDIHLAAVFALRARSDIGCEQVIGFHGQTVFHAPDRGITIQLGDGAQIASRAGVPVVWDFRTEDISDGGEGAPLAPIYHFALAKHIGAQDPIVFLNLGGVGNVTWVNPAYEMPEETGALVAFDTGPANALVNDWMHQKTGEPMDRHGGAAAQGRVHHARMSTNSGKAYLDRKPPKSLDRNDFHGVLAAADGLSLNDGAATLTAFTADCIAESTKHMPTPPARWLICGGGRHNATMMQMLRDRLDAPVDPVEAVGLDGDMLEAQAFAYLAVRVLRGLPTSAPTTTGCRAPVSGGRITYP